MALLVFQDLPYLNHVISKHARMLLEDTSPLISQREPGIRARLDHVNQGQALSDRTRIIAVVCVVIVLGVLAACCCLKPEIHERKESSGGLSDTFTCGMSEANSDTFLVKDHRGKSDMASNLHNLGDLPPDGARHGVRRSDECVILVSIQAPPNTSPRRIEQ